MPFALLLSNVSRPPLITQRVCQSYTLNLTPPQRPPPQLTSLKSRMPFALLLSNVSRWLLLNTNSLMNFSSGVVTWGRKTIVGVGKCGRV